MPLYERTPRLAELESIWIARTELLRGLHTLRFELHKCRCSCCCMLHQTARRHSDSTDHDVQVLRRARCRAHHEFTFKGAAPDTLQKLRQRHNASATDARNDSRFTSRTCQTRAARGVIWASSGRHLGDTWATPGRHKTCMARRFARK